MKKFKLCKVILPLLGLLIACKLVNAQELKKVIFNLSQMNSPKYTISVQSGTYDAEVAYQKFPAANIKEFFSGDDAAKALLEGKVDGFFGAHIIMHHLVNSNSNFVFYPEIVKQAKAAIAVTKSRPDLVEKLNAFIEKSEQDGSLHELYTNLVLNLKYPERKNKNEVQVLSDEEKIVRYVSDEEKSNTIIVGIEKDFVPLSYRLDNGELDGFLVVLMRRFSKETGIKVVFKYDYFGTLLSELLLDKIQVIASNTNVTEARKEKMLFTKDFLGNDFSMLVKKELLPTEESFHSFVNAKIGVIADAYNGVMALSRIPTATIINYDTNAKMLSDLKEGKIDAIAHDLSLLEDYAKSNNDLTVYPTPISTDSYAVATRKSEKELIRDINKIYAKFNLDGTFFKLERVWFGDEKKFDMPVSKPSGIKKLLKIGYIPDAYPFSYVDKNGEVLGYSIHALYMAMQELGYGISEMIPIEYKDVVTELISRNIDLAVGAVSITPDRLKIIGFTIPEYYTSNVMLVKKSRLLAEAKKEKNKKSFLSKLLGK
ncbi:MAG: transporter substrate-binding domain-containing protein [Alphaproteobacteria bacterium]|nr:transporter substrate-binding domain-containing protein [Alphaproteobacteria bacterium]